MTFHSFQSHAARVLRAPSPLAPRPARPPAQHRLCSPHSSAHKGLLGGSPPPGRPTSSTQASVLSSLQEPSLSTPWVPIALPPQGVVSPSPPLSWPHRLLLFTDGFHTYTDTPPTVKKRGKKTNETSGDCASRVQVACAILLSSIDSKLAFFSYLELSH